MAWHCIALYSNGVVRRSIEFIAKAEQGEAGLGVAWQRRSEALQRAV